MSSCDHNHHRGHLGKTDVPNKSGPFQRRLPVVSASPKRAKPFTPGFSWNLQKTGSSRRQLVVVDSSQAGGSSPASVTVVRCEPGATVTTSATSRSTPHVGTSSPGSNDDELTTSAAPLAPSRRARTRLAVAGADAEAGSSTSRATARGHSCQRGVIFNGLAVRRSALAGVHFDERRARQQHRLDDLRLPRGPLPPAPGPYLLSFWLCHTFQLEQQHQGATCSITHSTLSYPRGAQTLGDTEHPPRAA